MNITKTFEIITALYDKKPFLDENGQVTIVPNELDCIINSIELYEQALYQNSGCISDEMQISFLEKTQECLLSIPLEDFIQQVGQLEHTSQEIILRTLDRIFSKGINKTILSEYCKIFEVKSQDSLLT